MTSARCSTRSTPNGASSASRPARRLPGPAGTGGRWWYMVPRVGFPDPATFSATYAQLTAFLDGWLAERGIPWERTVIGGFSMGCVMSYATGLGPGPPLPRRDPRDERLHPDRRGLGARDGTRAGLPVFISHGARDPVISVDFARDARGRLEAAGLDVEYHEHGGGHHLDPRQLPAMQAWVAARTAQLAR